MDNKALKKLEADLWESADLLRDIGARPREEMVLSGRIAYCGANRPGLRSKTAAFRF